MSAAVACRKRTSSFLEESSTTSPPPYSFPVSKRQMLHRYSTSPEQVNPGDSVAAAASYRSEWVEVFLREMTSASTMDDAKARAYRLLEVLEKSINNQHASTEAASAESYSQKECVML